MSYHGYPPPDYGKTGIAVVNPLMQLQKRLDRIQKLIHSLPEKAMTTVELSEAIQKILTGE